MVVEDHVANNTTRIVIPIQPSQKSIEPSASSTPEPLGKKPTESQQQLSKLVLRKFKSWLMRFLEPTAFCTAIIAVCTILYTWSMSNYTADTNRLLRATENSIKQTEEHFGIQNRPYISISKVVESDNDETKSRELVIFFKNHGNTPAYNVNIEASIIIDGVSNKQNTMPNARSENTIFPQRELFYKFSINFPSKYPLKKEDFLRIEMLVEVQYSSMGKKRHTNERLFWDGGKTLVFSTLENN